MQKLKVKNAPAPKVKVMVKIPVEIKAEIKDMRKTGKINRTDFLRKIKTKVDRVGPIEMPSRIPSRMQLKEEREPLDSLALPPKLTMIIVGRREKKIKLTGVQSVEERTLERKTPKPIGMVLKVRFQNYV